MSSILKFDSELGKHNVETGEKVPYTKQHYSPHTTHPIQFLITGSSRGSQSKSTGWSLFFLSGFLLGGLAYHLIFNFYPGSEANSLLKTLADPTAGSTVIHSYPPTSATNLSPSLFPTSVGHEGPTLTGDEPGVAVTAPRYPIHTQAPELVTPKKYVHRKPKHFDLLKSLGWLSPWYSVDSTRFGLRTSPEPPDTCRVTGLHLLHRHGSRYPSGEIYASPAQFAKNLHESPETWNGTGDLKFLNTWTYKLGEEVLTTFGRQQLFDLGASMRLKYGFLLKNFTESNTIPVFRTESQDRMLKSAINFALGFFGYPLDKQYQQSITIEGPKFNNSLASYFTCDNFFKYAPCATSYVQKWTGRYLEKAQHRSQRQIDSKQLNLTIQDVYAMQKLCAYETVSLGYSEFCRLFTVKEWKDFDYSLDIYYWYLASFGSPVSRALGIGYVQELVARLTHTKIEHHNSSTNSTLDDNLITFPLNQSLYVDATHDIIIMAVLTALNLNNLAANGSLPYTHIPENRSFRSAELSPFASNVQFQLLSCTSVPGPQIRIIINDGVTTLTSIKGCPEQEDGMCPLDIFVAAQKETIATTDWNYACHEDWGGNDICAWETTTGDPPPRRYQ